MEIVSQGKAADGADLEGFQLKLLSRHQHREDLQAFRAPSLQEA